LIYKYKYFLIIS